MKRTLRTIALGLLLVGAATAVRADDLKGFRADLVGQFKYAQKQILDLESSIPDAKMTWRPNKEVRSISEVYSHIAFGNYLFGKFAGVALPGGIAVGTAEDGMKWEKASTDKKVIREQLVKSFDFLEAGIKNISDAHLEDMVTIFGQKMTVRSVLLVLLSHMHEHLGQSIAYARMVGVVPPWTAAQNAAEKKQK